MIYERETKMRPKKSRKPDFSREITRRSLMWKITESIKPLAPWDCWSVSLNPGRLKGQPGSATPLNRETVKLFSKDIR
jgi:hypothetical protein